MNQITIDLDDRTAVDLTDWLDKTSDHGNLPDLKAGEAIHAMIRVCLQDTHVTDLVMSQLQHERARAKDRDQGRG